MMWAAWSAGRKASLVLVSTFAFAAGFVSQQERVFEPQVPDPPRAAPTPTVTVTATPPAQGEDAGPERSRSDSSQPDPDLVAQPARDERANRSGQRSSGLSSSRSSSDEVDPGAGGSAPEQGPSGDGSAGGGSTNGDAGEGDAPGQGGAGAAPDEEADDMPPDMPPDGSDPPAGSDPDDGPIVSVCLDPLLCADADSPVVRELLYSESTRIPASTR